MFGLPLNCVEVIFQNYHHTSQMGGKCLGKRGVEVSLFLTKEKNWGACGESTKCSRHSGVPSPALISPNRTEFSFCCFVVYRLEVEGMCVRGFSSLNPSLFSRYSAQHTFMEGNEEYFMAMSFSNLTLYYICWWVPVSSRVAIKNLQKWELSLFATKPVLLQWHLFQTAVRWACWFCAKSTS